MSLATDDPRPKAVQIADQLRNEIGEGKKYGPGAKLPTRKDLAARFDVASQTVQNGLDILRAEGLIFSAGNRGVFVSKGEPEGEDIRNEIIEMRSQIQSLTERLEALEERPPSGDA
ncbi:GntR family transcriptional regulator [Streptomyces mayteni]